MKTRKDDHPDDAQNWRIYREVRDREFQRWLYAKREAIDRALGLIDFALGLFVLVLAVGSAVALSLKLAQWLGVLSW